MSRTTKKSSTSPENHALSRLTKRKGVATKAQGKAHEVGNLVAADALGKKAAKLERKIMLAASKAVRSGSLTKQGGLRT